MRKGRHPNLLQVAGLLTLILCALAASAEDPAEPDPAASEDSSYWLLEEFDWGDDKEVVEESLLFDPFFECRGNPHRRCIGVKVVLDGEELMARFDHHWGGLWQVVVLTPDLDSKQAKDHLERVWKGLITYVTRFTGEPTMALSLPDLESLEFGPPQPTHFWQKEGLAVRVSVGRRDEKLFYVGAHFSDPAREEVARPAWEAARARDDAKQRKNRAAKAARTGPGR